MSVCVVTQPANKKPQNVSDMKESEDGERIENDKSTKTCRVIGRRNEMKGQRNDLMRNGNLVEDTRCETTDNERTMRDDGNDSKKLIDWLIR